jgi:hypothetical protein
MCAEGERTDRGEAAGAIRAIHLLVGAEEKRAQQSRGDHLHLARVCEPGNRVLNIGRARSRRRGQKPVLISGVAIDGIFNAADDRGARKLERVRRGRPAAGPDDNGYAGAGRLRARAASISDRHGRQAGHPAAIDDDLIGGRRRFAKRRIQREVRPCADIGARADPGGANTSALLVTVRFETIDDPVMFHVVPFMRLTLEVDVPPVWIAPVRVDAAALRFTTLPAVAFVVPVSFTMAPLLAPTPYAPFPTVLIALPERVALALFDAKSPLAALPVLESKPLFVVTATLAAATFEPLSET